MYHAISSSANVLIKTKNHGPHSNVWEALANAWEALADAWGALANAWEAQTILLRNKLMQKLDSWLQQLPAALGSHWLSHRASTSLSNGNLEHSVSQWSQRLSSCSVGLKLRAQLVTGIPRPTMAILLTPLCSPSIAKGTD